jgi:hypothetical protein
MSNKLQFVVVPAYVDKLKFVGQSAVAKPSLEGRTPNNEAREPRLALPKSCPKSNLPKK